MEKTQQKVRKFKDRSGAKANALWSDISYTYLILLIPSPILESTLTPGQQIFEEHWNHQTPN